MIPNLHIHEQLMFERVKALQQEFEQQRLLKGVPRSRFQIIRRGTASLGGLFGAVGASLKRVTPSHDSMAHKEAGR
jgi:hypothetical protein